MSERNLARLTSVRIQGFKRDLLWLAPAVLSTLCVFYFYLDSHPYPSFGSGLYMLISERIIEAGYALPETIPYYTDEGVPFAYPPLMFYVVAVIRDVTGLGPIAISRYLPGVVTVAYLVPTYLLARDLLASRPQAAVASLVVAVSPPVLRWHISAGGVVRAPAFLLAVTGIYAGLRLYRDRDSRWVVPSLVLFGLTVLTHPMYTVFFALSYFLLYLQFDRTRWGLTRGMVAGFGGILLAAPWWTQVMAIHGVDVFTGAAGTHGGIGGGVPALAEVTRIDFTSLEVVWQLLPVVGIVYLFRLGRYFLPVWLVAVTLALGKPRFSVFVGAFVVAVFLLEGVWEWLNLDEWSVSRRRLVTVALVGLATVGVAGGAMYASGAMNAHAGSPSQPQFIDREDVAAMNWVERNTASDATFVVQGDAAEWFPQQTRRTMLVGPWGVEWKGSDAYTRQLELYEAVSECNSAQCMSATLAEENVRPDYIYLPKGRFTVRGMEYQRTSQLAMSMHVSPEYQTVYENEGVIVFETMAGEGE
ncbi:glycosyltransferase family 39 protein (plasmid) [Halorussus salilacus]|uniref:ArnT family glycosyltransferase n=1 Tax=Halorussus salilacus TaxID=2953750 RepID=UPI00209DAB50|nr:glycosyltransferase family 39 protein [Halorussus salilacus]USZ69789.1 glycosyltransferase family 39 protein [Halorussus salilacus]